jgi:hypothetical protein
VCNDFLQSLQKNVKRVKGVPSLLLLHLQSPIIYELHITEKVAVNNTRVNQPEANVVFVRDY